MRNNPNWAPAVAAGSRAMSLIALVCLASVPGWADGKAGEAETGSTKAPCATAPKSSAAPQATGSTVVCQRQINGNTLVRRVRTPQGCFDEFVNMYTGQIMDRRPAPCAPC
jgi:hypothetical protein